MVDIMPPTSGSATRAWCPRRRPRGTDVSPGPHHQSSGTRGREAGHRGNLPAVAVSREFGQRRRLASGQWLGVCTAEIRAWAGAWEPDGQTRRVHTHPSLSAPRPSGRGAQNARCPTCCGGTTPLAKAGWASLAESDRDRPFVLIGNWSAVRRGHPAGRPERHSPRPPQDKRGTRAAPVNHVQRSSRCVAANDPSSHLCQQ